MERKKLWDEFLKTGKIEDYLKFKERNKKEGVYEVYS